jgi:hypothetical protein
MVPQQPYSVNELFTLYDAISQQTLTGEPKNVRRVMGKADRHPLVEAKNAVQQGAASIMPQSRLKMQCTI